MNYCKACSKKMDYFKDWRRVYHPEWTLRWAIAPYGVIRHVISHSSENKVYCGKRISIAWQVI